MRHLISKRNIALSLALVLALFVSFAVSAAADEGKVKHDFTLNDQDGKAVKLSELAGKVVVLEWLNPDCPFTQRHYKPENQTVVNLVEKYKGKDVVILSINSTNYFDQAKNKAWHTEMKLKHQILDDHDGTVGKHFKARSTPHIYIIDTKGHLVYNGAIDNDQFGDKPAGEVVNYVSLVVDELLAGKKPSITETKPYGCSVKYAN